MKINLLVGIIILTSLVFSCKPNSLEGEIHETLYLRHQGADMPAYIHGNAASKTFLVVLHGAGSFGLAFRDGAFTNELEKDYTVVYFDQRGQSMAQGHYRTPDDLIDLMASDIEALLKLLKHKYGEDISLFLMGHSWGGLLSGATLLRPGVQDMLKGWINVAGLMDLPSASRERKEIIQAIAEEQIILNINAEAWAEIRDEAILLDPESDEAAILKLAARTMAQLIADETIRSTLDGETLYRALIDNNPVSWQVSWFFNQPVSYAKEVDFSLLGSMAQIRLPALFLYGKYDVSVPVTAGRKAFLELGSTDKKFERFDASIHHPHDTEPTRFVEEMRIFINSYR